MQYGFQEIVYNNVKKDGKINLAFHQVFDEVGGIHWQRRLRQPEQSMWCLPRGFG